MALNRIDISMLEDAGTSGQVLTSDGTNWTSADAAAPLPAVGPDGNVLTSDGTDWASEESAGGGDSVFPFYKTDGTSDNITITSGQFPFYKADGTLDNIAAPGGGTGLSIAIPGSSVTGDTLYHDGSVYARLPKGTAAQVLKMNSGATAPEWGTVDSSGALDGSPANHTANGPQTNTYPAGYAATVMDLVYMGQDSKWLKADADQESTSIGLLGISLESKTDTQPMNVALPGSFVRSTTWGWTVGVPLYIHTTDGSITATKPTGSGDIVRTIGFSVQVEYIFFNPSSDYITLV